MNLKAVTQPIVDYQAIFHAIFVSLTQCFFKLQNVQNLLFTNKLFFFTYILKTSFNWEKFCWLTIKYWFSQQKVNIKKLAAFILSKTFVYYEYFDSSDVLNVLNKKQKIRKNRSLNLLNSFCHYIFKTLCNMYCMQPAFLRRIDWNWLNKDHITGS